MTEKYVYGVIYDYGWEGKQFAFLNPDLNAAEQFYNSRKMYYGESVYLVKIPLNEDLWPNNWEIIKTTEEECLSEDF